MTTADGGGPGGHDRARRSEGPPLVGAERVDRSQAGARWWMYRRPEPPPPAWHAAPAANGAHATGGGAAVVPGRPVAGAATAPAPEPAVDRSAGITLVAAEEAPFVMRAVLGAIALLLAIALVRFGKYGAQPFLVPLGALLLAGAFAQYSRRAHPDEPWLGRMVFLGVAAKLASSYFRHLSVQLKLEQIGDAGGYDAVGSEFARAWLRGTSAPELENLRQTNFLKYFTGIVYYVFGINILTGYLVFGLFAVLGSYFWYRATADAVPFLDKRLYLALVLFAPSIVFWPSNIGKESLMQLGIGVMALGTSNLLRSHLLRGLLICAPGGWLLWVVRPHLLALVAVAGGLAYLLGRVKRTDGRAASLLSRPVGIIVIALLVVFTISQGAQFLGIKTLSFSSVEDELNSQTERSTRGGSSFDNGGNSLNPIYLPRGAATVLLRPFPWETETGFQRLASIESALVAMFLVIRFRSLSVAIAQSRRYPYLAYCFILTLLYAEAFASFANFGLLVRQRSLVLPALYVLMAVDPRRFRAMSTGQGDPRSLAAPAQRLATANGRTSAPVG